MIDNFEDLLNWFGEYKDGIISLGVFLAAAATVVSSLLASRISHRSRISELREHWIERLREDISEITEARIINYRMHRKEFSVDDYILKISRFKILSNKIKMRLNLMEEKHKKLSDLIDLYIDKDTPEEMNDVEAEIISLSRAVFRDEWKKAVRGKM